MTDEKNHVTSRPRAITTGVLKFGDAEVDVYNLEDGRRVMSQRGVVRGLVGAPSGHVAGNTPLGRFLSRLPNRFAHLSLSPTVEFELPQGGATALGREAGWFIDVCNAYVDAAVSGELHPAQMKLAAQARGVLSATSKVGIAALIDEATGFQYVREEGVLSQLWSRALRDEAAPWQKMWQDDVVDALCRLFGIQRSGRKFPMVLNGVVGKLYRTLMGPELHDELKRRNPRGAGRNMHHQHMTADMRQQLDKFLEVVRALTFASSTPDEFYLNIERYTGRQASPATRRERLHELQLTLWRLFGDEDNGEAAE